MFLLIFLLVACVPNEGVCGWVSTTNGKMKNYQQRVDHIQDILDDDENGNYNLNSPNNGLNT